MFDCSYFHVIFQVVKTRCLICFNICFRKLRLISKSLFLPLKVSVSIGTFLKIVLKQWTQDSLRESLMFPSVITFLRVMLNSSMLLFICKSSVRTVNIVMQLVWELGIVQPENDRVSQNLIYFPQTKLCCCGCSTNAIAVLHLAYGSSILRRWCKIILTQQKYFHSCHGEL